MKKKTFECEKCYRCFTTKRGLASHSRMHKNDPLPKPQPKTDIVVADRTMFDRSYKSMKGKIEIGDVFYRVEKHVATEIVSTDDSNDVRVKSLITKSYWTSEKPQ